jgi:hypothetical protein
MEILSAVAGDAETICDFHSVYVRAEEDKLPAVLGFLLTKNKKTLSP